MTEERLRFLNTHPEATLTIEEIYQGWHFCPEWDGMLIGPDDPEIKCCSCYNRRSKLKIAVHKQTPIQIGPDEWGTDRIVKIFDSSATMDEIIAWSNGNASKKFIPIMSMVEEPAPKEANPPSLKKEYKIQGKCPHCGALTERFALEGATSIGIQCRVCRQIFTESWVKPLGSV